MTFIQAIQAQIDKDRKRATEHGWRFNDRTPDHHTIGDLIAAVMAVDNPEDAKQFYQGYIEFLEVQPDRTHPSKYVADSNIGWCFGEGMSEERKQIWCSVTSAAHPIFGRTTPTMRQAFEAGKETVCQK